MPWPAYKRNKLHSKPTARNQQRRYRPMTCSISVKASEKSANVRQAVTDVRDSVDPQMWTIQAEIDAAKKEIQQSIEAAKELPPVQEDPQKSE